MPLQLPLNDSHAILRLFNLPLKDGRPSSSLTSVALKRLSSHFAIRSSFGESNYMRAVTAPVSFDRTLQFPSKPEYRHESLPSIARLSVCGTRKSWCKLIRCETVGRAVAPLFTPDFSLGQEPRSRASGRRHIHFPISPSPLLPFNPTFDTCPRNVVSLASCTSKTDPSRLPRLSVIAETTRSFLSWIPSVRVWYSHVQSSSINLLLNHVSRGSTTTPASPIPLHGYKNICQIWHL